MALVWLPLDDETIDRMLVLARSPWTPAELDRTWAATGWALPGGLPLAAQVFDDLTYTFGTGDRLLRLGMRFDPDEITSFSVDFATYSDSADPDAADFGGPDALGAGWSVDPDATRADFDARWREGVDAVAARLGDPLIGRHGRRWHHALWRLRDALVVVAQSESSDDYADVEDALLCVAHHPGDTPIPRDEELRDFLLGA
ncbi:hypothetical protein JOF41_003095 [Saccharothrix coeruleofusca]|uniref:hypothetical protein n=1 Tax=Saccharothrix coeruleofusca TaxID=33919 RepID=UPI001AE9E206|nr:hypothetical protein [Saccharothrix coeruleofusca]MBP2336917.1 hypothetical protein [Saccharothrix coeruleofusca]